MILDRWNKLFYNRFHKGGGNYDGPLKTGLTIVIILTAVRMDICYYKIKNELIFVGMMTGISFWLLSDSSIGGSSVLCGVLLPILICWIPFRMYALGAGDLKLFSVIGCLHGGRDIIYCIGFSFLLAAGISLGKLLSQKELLSSMSNCFQYFRNILSEGKMIPYPGKDAPDHRFHFSTAIFLGYLTLLGVKLCKNTLLC